MYGMTEHAINKAKYKIKANKAYMKSHGIVIDNKIVPFIDFVANSYINSDRYIAELQHRAWSIYEYAQSKGLSNLFLTLTLPSVWHPKKEYKGKLIKNKKFGGRYYIGNKVVHPITGEVLKLINSKENIEKYSPKSASKELSRLLDTFRNQRIYRSINLDDRCYFRVTEPHKDGTPHLHVSFFFPKEHLKALEAKLLELFPFPQAKVVLDVDSPVKYLLKYVLKTLDDLREDKNNITALSLWYVYHGISRFYTSRTFVSLEVYRKLNGMYTLLQLTDAYNSELLKVQINTQTNKIGLIENEHGIIYNAKYIVSTFESPTWRADMDIENDTYMDYEFEPIKFIQKAPHYIDIDIDGEDYVVYDGSLQSKSKSFLIKLKHHKHPSDMNNIELYSYFNSLDLENVNLDHYASVHNQCLDRGLIDGVRITGTELKELSSEYLENQEAFSVFNVSLPYTV
jgi:hypothetical protein